MSSRRRPWLILLALVAVACRGGSYGPGGGGPRVPPPSSAFSFPDPALRSAEVATFRIGDRFFTEPWSPAVEGADAERDGLGPTYVATSCAGCHVRDGKATAPARGGSVVYRIPTDAAYGSQIQDRAVPGVPTEARLERTDTTEVFTYPDGATVVLHHPRYRLDAPAFGEPLAGRVGSPRSAPALIGLGLLEAVPESTVLAVADPDDTDHDGISGRPNRIGGRLGRFGWKASQVTVLDQTAGAYHEDMGITSPVHPEENCPGPQVECRRAPSGGRPEISAERLAAVALYAATLAVPEPADPQDEAVAAGRALFEQVGCAGCHRPQLTTGTWAIAGLSGRTIRPYTDLLVHDMGPGLADAVPVEGVGAAEWRTAPLWGLGRVQMVNPEAGFLHDGRAATIEEAILWHGGEARRSRDAFTALDVTQRAALLAFLDQL